LEIDALRERRQRIDGIDAEVVRLLNERARIAQEIGNAKSADARLPFAPEREREVLERVRKLGQEGPLEEGHLVAIYREIISACRNLERPLQVAYLGPAASFTHQAALERFGEATDLIAMDSIPDVFAETQRGRADFGVVPVENSSEGSVHLTLDSFIESDLQVCSEIVLPISHHLMSRSPIDQVRTLYSNPVALAQCRQWVARNLPGREIVEVASTTRAAMMAADDPSGAAIAPHLAAMQYKLDFIAQDIQDLASNYTRFYVVASGVTSEPSGRDKTAIIFSIRDRVGALRDAADVFARRALNMASIQSRPSRRKAWDYVFFVEFEGHERDTLVREALDELKDQCSFVKALGSWPIDDAARSHSARQQARRRRTDRA
jgi:chorismate mutase/prephenate dehydratase